MTKEILRKKVFEKIEQKYTLHFREHLIVGDTITETLAGLHEGQPKWHDLRKDPNDLPQKVEDERQISDTVWIHIHNWGTEEGHYDYRKCNWIVRCRIVNLDVIAWCEIPQFKE